jgi:AraC-like DNA-binding protein
MPHEKVIGLLGSAAVAATLQERLDGATTIRRLSTPTQLVALVQRVPVIAVVLEISRAWQSASLTAAYLLRRHGPTIPVVAVTTLSTEHIRLVVAVARRGLDDVLILDADDDRAIAKVIDRSALCHALERILSASKSEEGTELVAATIRSTLSGGSILDLAASLGMSERSLQRAFRSSHLPPPREVRSWIRVIHAVYLLRCTGLTIDRIAQQAGYGSPARMRHEFVRLLHSRPGELRETRTAISRAVRAARSALSGRVGRLGRLRVPGGAPE